MHVKHSLPIVIFTFALLGSACSATSPKGESSQAIAAPANDVLLGVQWRVEDLNGSGVIDSSNTTFTLLPEGRAAGMAGCNNFSAAYRLSGAAVAFDTLVTTRKACVPALNNQEQHFLELLRVTTGYRFDRTGALFLETSDGRHIKAHRLDN